MSEMEVVNLEQTSKKQRQQRQSRQQRDNRPIRKQKRFNKQRRNSQFKNRGDRQRSQDWNQQNERGNKTRDLYEIDIYNFLAHNRISDLINDINSRCGNLAKLHVIANNPSENEAETKIILKAFFKDQKSAEECCYQYNEAQLDNLFLRTEKKF